MWAVMCVCRHVCHTQARSCLSTGWALNRCFAWGFGTVAVLAQGGGGVPCIPSSSYVASEAPFASTVLLSCLCHCSLQWGAPMPPTSFRRLAVAVIGIFMALAAVGAGAAPLPPCFRGADQASDRIAGKWVRLDDATAHAMAAASAEPGNDCAVRCPGGGPRYGVLPNCVTECQR